MNWLDRICQITAMKVTQEMIVAHNVIAMLSEGIINIVHEIELVKCSFVTRRSFKANDFDCTKKY
jgi:hypothetical protein